MRRWPVRLRLLVPVRGCLQRRCLGGEAEAAAEGEGEGSVVWKLGRAMMEYHNRYEKYHDGVDYRTSRALARLGLAHEDAKFHGKHREHGEAEIRQGERDFNQGMEQLVLLRPEKVQPLQKRGNAAQLNVELRELMTEFRRGWVADVAALLLRSEATPDAATFNILIRRFTLFRNNVLARLAFVSMLEAKIRPDAYTISALLSLATASGNYVEFRKVVGVLNSKQIKLTIPINLMLYGALINGSVKFGRVDHAEMYFRACKRKFEPSQPILTSMLRMYAKHGMVDAGMQIWQELKDLETAGRFTIDAFAKEAMRELCNVDGLPTSFLHSPSPKKTKGLTAHPQIKLPHPPTPHTPHLRKWAKQRLSSANEGLSSRFSPK